jgi:phenylpyruvate tautomerase PptA (4-oxalocrotonate tautomerase family)
MPHVIVKLWTGKSEEQKNRLAGRSASRTLLCPGTNRKEDPQ